MWVKTGAMIERTQIEPSGATCPDGHHEFCELGSWEIVVGQSRCRACGTVADQVKVDGRRPTQRRVRRSRRRNATA
jgi:hypothetical protein